jgi:hypothetical protein
MRGWKSPPPYSASIRGRQASDVIDSRRLLFSLRSELDEQQFQLDLLTEDKGSSNEVVARQTGYVEALRDVLSSVEARAKKSDRPTFAEIEGQAV